jgi:folate-binding protein YgfZ
MTLLTDQYRIIAAGAGWFDRRARGRLRFDGRDRASFLHALVTNDVVSLSPGQGVYAAYLTPQGRMLADLTIHCGDDYLLAEVPEHQEGRLAERFDQLIFTEDVRVSDVTADMAQVTAIGAEAAAVLAGAFGDGAADAERIGALPVRGHVEMAGVLIARTDEVELPAFDVFIRAGAYEAATRRLGELGAVQGSPALVDALRIEAGRPVFGLDMTEETIPLEAGILERAISTTKGCYVGQEVIIRVLHRGGGRVAKRLVTLRFDDALENPPAAGTVLLVDGREAGRVTSVAISPPTGRVIALGYLHRDHAETGVRVTLAPEAGSHFAEVAGLAG